MKKRSRRIGKKEIEWQCADCRTRLDGYLVDGDFISAEEIRKYGQQFAGVGCPNCGSVIGEEITVEELAEEWDAEDGVYF